MVQQNEFKLPKTYFQKAEFKIQGTYQRDESRFES